MQYLKNLNKEFIGLKITRKMSFFDFFKNFCSSKPKLKIFVKKEKDKYELEGWEKPYLAQFRDQNSSYFSMIQENFNKKDIAFTFDIQMNDKIEQEKSFAIKLEFLDENIFKFSSSNLLKKSKFDLSSIIPLDLKLSPNEIYDFEDKAEKINIIKKNDASFKLSINKNPFFIDVLNSEGEKIVGLNQKNCFSSSPYPAFDFNFDHEFLFGIPERAEHFLLPDSTKENPYRLFNLDRFGYDIYNKSGVYGSVPLLIAQYPKKTVGIFWRNASLTYIDIMKNKNKSNCLWLSECGDLEFYIIPALSQQDLFLKLGKLLGFAPLPPYFSFGYHHSKWSFKDQKDVEEIDKNFDLHKIPYDVIYLDIDYTDEKKYFTYDLALFPKPLEMIDKLAAKGRKLVTIIDPHIKKQEGYFLYEEAVKNNYFVKDEKNIDFEGKCWPGDSHWLDYLNKDVEKYWASLYAYDKFIYSKDNVHIWNDMNEPSVFGGPDSTMPKTLIHKVQDQNGELMDVEHKEVHNLYGYCQARGTYTGLIERNEDKNQRAFLLTRSFFAGIQKYSAVWTGDTLSTWPYLKITLPMLLSLSVSGISFCGGDIGGFQIDPTDDLHIRWFQSAVIYPFFRGHSAKDAMRREPWLYDKKIKEMIRDAILLRYEILPYIYTVFYEYTKTNIPVLRPLWYLLPEKLDIYGVDDQMLLGDCILSSPILEEKQTSITLETVKEFRWFCYHTLKEIDCSKPIKSIELSYNPLFIKEGSILVLWDIRNKEHFRGTRDLLEKFEFKMIIVVDRNENANGKFYIDDGKTFNHINKDEYLYSEISFSKGILSYNPISGKNWINFKKKIKMIEIVGLQNLQKVVLNKSLKTSVKIEKSKGITVKLNPDIDDIDISHKWTLEIYKS